ncbi:hypothetical protein BKA69DRAFT_107590 [Paraphysoderma sedebokerense]|nr:hypothetical protein BKA69DRAFT_107590 [Paraphysoderma sedebokerense]
MDAQSHQSSRLPSLDDARNDIIASSQAHYPIASAKVHIPRLSEYTPLSPETDLDVDIPPFDFPRPSSHHASFPYSTSSTSNPSEMAATATLLQYNQYPAIHIKPRPHILPLDPASIHSIPTKKPTPLHLDSVAEEFAHPAKKRRNDNSIILIGTSADESLRYLARKLPQSSSSTSSKTSHALPRLATANSYPEEPKRTTTSNQSSSIPTPTSATIESHPSSFSQASPCSHKLKSPSLSSSSLSTLSLPQSHDNPTVPTLSLQFNPSSHPILLEFFNLLQSHYSNLGSSNSRLSGADETGIWRLKQSPYPSPALSSAPSYSPLPLFTTVASSDRLSSSCSSVTSLPSLSNANYNPYFPRVNSTHLSIPLSAQAQLNYNQRAGALCKPNSVMLELPWSKKLKVMYEKDGESRIGKQFLQLQRGKCKDAVREDVIHWIMKVNDTHPHFGYHSETLHLMVSYMDHFLQSTRVARINQFYLLGLFTYLFPRPFPCRSQFLTNLINRYHFAFSGC